MYVYIYLLAINRKIIKVYNTEISEILKLLKKKKKILLKTQK